MIRLLPVLLMLLAAAPAAAQGPTMRFSGDIVIPRGTVHEGSALTMNGRIVIDGTLRGDALTMNGDIAVSGTVRGSVRAINGDITLASSAVVDGDVWSANGRIIRAPGAQVRGRVRQEGWGQAPPPPIRERWEGRWSWRWPGMMRAMATWTFAGFVVLAAVAAALFPLQVRQVADALRRSPGESLLAGVVLWIALPPLALLLTLSVVGIPAVAFLPFAVLLLGLAGLAGASQLIGDRILGGFQQQHQIVTEAVVGAALLGALVFIPGLGWLAIFAAFTWGIGAVVLVIFRRIRGTSAPSAPASPPPVPS
ncbi:MAG TPA: polymer-forming cytoskeletal protein [bacterium]|nr:polymer-forming cytoskeletal protein [bacterium]